MSIIFNRRLLVSFMSLLFLAYLPVAAQQKPTFRVASFAKDPTRTAALNEEFKKLDGNNKPYAIIHVTSNNPGDDLNAYEFDFGYISSFKRMQGSELWVYVANGGLKLQIRRQGFADCSYELPQKIEAGMDYIMQLSTSGPVFITRMVEFRVKPAGVKAVVMMKSSKAGAQPELFGTTDASGATAKSLELGTYSYTVAADNYYTIEGTVTLTRGNDNFIEEVTLKPNFGEVTLKVAGDAEIFLNGQSKGRGTWTGTLKAGNYTVECRQQNHRPSSQYITVVDKDTRTFELTPPTPITGTIAITSNPSGAKISIDGMDAGYVTPRQISNLIIGNHTVTISMNNRKPETRTVEIKENLTTDLNVTLSDIARMTIRSVPSGADLQIGGRNVGSTPYSSEMASGDYDLRLTYPRFQTFSQRVHLDSSDPEKTIIMKRQLQQATSGYVAVGFQAPALTSLTATVGMYLFNVNLEVSYLLGFQHSDEIFWNYTGEGNERPITCRYKAGGLGGKLGYGICVGTRFRVTPQLGMNIVNVKSDNGDSKCHVVQATVGARADFAIVNHFGVYLAPEFGFAMKKSDIYGQIEPLSPVIKKWGGGFNVRVGLTFFF